MNNEGTVVKLATYYSYYFELEVSYNLTRIIHDPHLLSG